MDNFTTEEDPTASVGVKPWHPRQIGSKTSYVFPVNIQDWCGCRHSQLYSMKTSTIYQLRSKKKKKDKRKTLSVVIDMNSSVHDRAAVDNRECCCTVPKVSRIDGFLAGTSSSWINVSHSESRDLSHDLVRYRFCYFCTWCWRTVDR